MLSLGVPDRHLSGALKKSELLWVWSSGSALCPRVGDLRLFRAEMVFEIRHRGDCAWRSLV